MVELANSNKISKTGVSGQTLQEAKSIGISLGSLGNVIQALTSKNKFVPYRDSKLTRLLQNSLGGCAKTLFIVNISPSLLNYDETLSSLRFGSRARTINNHPKINSKIEETTEK